MIKTRLLTLVMALMLLLAIPTSVFAQNARPHVFVGTVTLDGAGAANGAAVTAWVDDAQVAATTVTGGQYNLLVIQTGDASFAGKTVSFKVSNANAEPHGTTARQFAMIGEKNHRHRHEYRRSQILQAHPAAYL